MFKKIKIGDSVEFKNKLKWQIVSINKSFAGIIFYKYKVFRKYNKHGWLSNTDCDYTIFKERWNFIKQEIKKDKNYYYNKH